MTLAYSTRYQKYQPVVLTDEYIVPFPIFDTDDLRVVVDATDTTAFSVTATFVNGRSDDASITLTAAVTDVDVEIYGRRNPARTNSYLANSPNLATNLQADADILTAVQQEQQRDFDRTVKLSAGLGIQTEISTLVDGSALIYDDATGKIIAGPSASAISAAEVNAISAAASAVSAANSASVVSSYYTYGAVGDGVTDDADAVEDALRSGDTLRNPRNAVFLCGRTISAPNVSTFVRGGILKFTGGTDGVQLHHTGAYTVNWDDCEILTTQELSGNGLSITYDDTTAANERHVKFATIGSGFVAGGTDDETGAWTWGIYTDNLNNSLIDHPLIRGRKNMAAGATTEDRYYLAGSGGILIESTGSGSPVNVVIREPHVRSVAVGIKCLGPMEGIKVLNPHIPSCNTGVWMDPTGTDPGWWIVDGHINAASRCILMENAFEVQIHGNELYRFSSVNSINWQAYEFDTVSELKLFGDKINGYNTTGTPGTVVVGTLTNTKRAQISDLQITRCTSGLDSTDANSINNRFRNIDAFDGAAKSTYQTVTFSGGAAASNTVAHHAGAGLLGSATGITVASGTTNVVSKSIPDAAVGEIYAVDVEFEALKGGTLGLTKLFVTQTGGTGTVTMDLGAAIDIWQGADVPAAGSFRATGRGFVTVTVAGTVQLTVQGQSAGSDSTVGAAIRVTRIA